MINAEKLTFGFTSTPLFENISFHLDKNCHCVLIGSNGTGKTTLVNLIRDPDQYIFSGKLTLENAGRIGYVSQFAIREGDQSVTVYDYLCQDFLELEQAINDVCLEMESAEDMDAVMERYQTLLDESDAMDADNYEVNIRLQLKLAELEDKASLELEKLSGGELKLVQVIRQMLRRPGLLIMDEPDVFLDFENLNGLRDLVNAYKGTLLVITHSRYLLAHCFDRIWHLENGDLQEYEGNFTEYSYSRLQKKIDLQLAALDDEEEVQRITELVERLRKDATEVIDPQLGRTLKGKVSYLNRLLDRQIKAPFVEIRQPEIQLPQVDVPEEAEELLRLDNYSLAFEDTLLEGVSFAVHSGEKVALVGANGTGKTSMLRQIWKNQHPAVHFSESASPAFFSQLHAEILSEQNSIYEELFACGFETHAQVEEYLSKYCFDPDSLRRKVGNLSGGEKNLLQLAKLAASQANILLLDEPSSHLDTFAQIALEDAIANYQGAILMVSHDFYTIVNCADTILFVENGGIRPMSARAFRKMIYKKHFSKEYLELELQKKDLETRIQRNLEAGDCGQAQQLCDKLAAIVEQMQQAWQEQPMTEKEKVWDALLRIHTTGRDEVNADEYYHPYEPTPYCVLERLADSGLIRSTDTVLDYGCGKGRVGLYLTHQTGASAIGIEYDPRIYQSAVENRETARSKADFVLAKAEAYAVPPQINRCYFFNPFSVEILHKVLSRILDSYYAAPREILLFFYYPLDEFVAYLMTVDALEFYDEIECDDLFPGADHRERILIFSLPDYEESEA